MMTNEKYTKIVNFMIPGARVFVLGYGHASHIVKCVISLKIFFTPMHRSDKLSIK